MQCCSVKGSAEELPKALGALKKLLQVLAPAAAVQAPGMVPQGRPRGADPAFTEDAVIGAHVANRETPQVDSVRLLLLLLHKEPLHCDCDCDCCCRC